MMKVLEATIREKHVDSHWAKAFVTFRFGLSYSHPFLTMILFSPILGFCPELLNFTFQKAIILAIMLNWEDRERERDQNNKMQSKAKQKLTLTGLE